VNVCLGAGDGEFVALLNNDVELDPDCLGELVAAMREHPGAASAGAKLLDYRDRGVIDGAGDIFIWHGLPARRGHGEPDVGQYDRPRAIFGACGAVSIYRRDALRAVGRFDDRFFAFYEDSDWSFRAQLAGWDCRYVPSAVAFHMGSATVGSAATDFTRYHLWHNGIWLVAKNYPLAAFVLQAPRLAIGHAGHLRDAIREHRLGIWRRAMLDGLRGLPRALRWRRYVQRRRVRTLRELDAIVGPDR